MDFVLTFQQFRFRRNVHVGEGASGGGGDANADADGEGVPGGDDVVETSPPKSGGKKGRKSKGKGKKKGGSGEGEEEDEDALGTSHVRVGFLCRAMRRRVHEPKPSLENQPLFFRFLCCVSFCRILAHGWIRVDLRLSTAG